MEDACRNEVERLHEFFVDWFTGSSVGDSASADMNVDQGEFGERCLMVLSPDMTMIAPSGVLLNHAQLVEGLLARYACHQGKQFSIEIRNAHVLYNNEQDSDILMLLTYQEVQLLDGVETSSRQSTALFRSKEGTPCGVEWVYLQETWINADQQEVPSSITPSPTPNKTAVVEKPEFVRVTSLVSTRRHLSPNLSLYQATVIEKQGEVVGIELNRWKISTQQGSIGDDAWFCQATERLQEIAQPKRSATIDHAETHSVTYRHICLPEMVFPRARITLEAKDGPKLEFGAYPALLQWAKAHQAISLGSSEEYDGVSVLKVADAKLWSSKATRLEDGAAATEGTPTAHSNFHYDWTFSTPHACTTTMDVSWKPLDSSGMNLALLQDRTVPILLFDEIVLYEDDLHDNGQVTLTCKIRVMPTCVYCLERLWVRIDGVLLRVREARVSLEFGLDDDDGQSTTKLFRDVVWRQCLWQDLETHGLPTDLRLWCPETGGISESAWQEALSKLPEVKLPSDLPAHAVLDETGS